MLTRTIIGLLIGALAGKSAVAAEKYSIHENLHVGQKITYSIVQETEDKSDSTSDGKRSVTDTYSAQYWKVTETVLAVKDGSATRIAVDVGPDSYDTTAEGQQADQRTPSPFAGRTITLANQPDGTISTDFNWTGANASSEDMQVLDGILDPDEDNYPDSPVAVEDTWDNSAKQSKDLGPKDRLSAIYHLDWVKTIGGRQIGQISFASKSTYHVDAGPDGRIETDQVSEQTGTMLVDIAEGSIVKGDFKTTSHITTPPDSAYKLTEDMSQTSHSQTIADTGVEPATKP
jgi:hypothetical protein